MKVTFVIPHRGRIDLLQKTLASIWQQTHAEKEVIVVTQNPDLRAETLQSSQGEQPVVLDATAAKTISQQRNMGAAASSGQYLAFLDADIELPKDWLSVLLKVFKTEPEWLLLSSLQVVPDVATDIEKIRANLANKGVGEAIESLPGSNLLLAKSTFEQAGGFPEHLATCEDIYFTQAVAQLGKIKRTALTSHIHLGEDKSLRVVFKKEIWRGQSNIHSLKGREIPLKEWPSLLVPFWVTFFMLVNLVSLWNGAVALSAAVGLLLPLVLYALRAVSDARIPVSFVSAVIFYSVYFPARCWGTSVGIFKTIQVRQG